MALRQCEECGSQVSDQAETCPHCGAPNDIVESITQREKEWYERTSITLCFAAILILFALGFVHIITGVTSLIGLPIDIAVKDSFGYSETFINAHKVTGMPWIAAKSRYPLGCKVLQRKGYIESDAEFKERVHKEAQEEFRQEYETVFRQFGGNSKP